MILAPPQPRLWTPPWWRLPRWADLAQYTTGKLRYKPSRGKVMRGRRLGKLGTSSDGTTSHCCPCFQICGSNAPNAYRFAITGMTWCSCYTSGNDFSTTVNGGPDGTLENVTVSAPPVGSCWYERMVPLEETPWTVDTYEASEWPNCITPVVTPGPFFIRVTMLLSSGAPKIGDLRLIYLHPTFGQQSIGDLPFSSRLGTGTGCVSSSTFTSGVDASPCPSLENRMVAYGGMMQAVACD